jgi:hypothetical protein
MSSAALAISLNNLPTSNSNIGSALRCRDAGQQICTELELNCLQNTGTSSGELAEALRLVLGFSRRHRWFALKAYVTARPVIAVRTRLALRAIWTQQLHNEAAIRTRLLMLPKRAAPLLPEGLLISPAALACAVFSSDGLARIVLAATEEVDEAVRAALSLASGTIQDDLGQMLIDQRGILAAQRALLTGMLAAGARSGTSQ